MRHYRSFHVEIDWDSTPFYCFGIKFLYVNNDTLWNNMELIYQVGSNVFYVEVVRDQVFGRGLDKKIGTRAELLALFDKFDAYLVSIDTKFGYLENADSTDASITNWFDAKTVSISPNTLIKLMTGDSEKECELPLEEWDSVDISFGKDGRFEVIDAINDEIIYLYDYSLQELQKLAKSGYTPIPRPDSRRVSIEDCKSLYAVQNAFYHLHQAGKVLLLDKVKDCYYYCGFDDDQYFGCELPHGYQLNKLWQAEALLMPESLRSSCLAGENPEYKRQGEWFFIPVDSGCIKPANYHEVRASSYVLPLDDVSSNEHELVNIEDCVFDLYLSNGDEEVTAFIDSGEELEVHHNEHPTLKLGPGFYRICKNTAVASFSVEGVD